MTTHTFAIPPHIAAAGIAGRPIDFEWEEGNTRQYYHDRTSDQLSAKIRPISPRGKLALSAAIAEWVIWRLDGLAAFDDARDYVAAAWAAVIDSRYLLEWGLPDDVEPAGPALEPQWIAAHLLDDVFEVGERRAPNTYQVNYLAFLAQHVVGSHPAYKRWLAAAMERLVELSPISPATREFYKTTYHTKAEVDGFEWGAPVPRAALDTTRDYDVAQVPADLDAYLRSLDPASNPFLATPEALLDEGFEGTPYTYPPR
ncbi:MAG: hypothetical protein HC927_10455 [Deltaproteobacteria bacterium]|nr:hypothetical protein [Deltaproteobacteria bacterium]